MEKDLLEVERLHYNELRANSDSKKCLDIEFQFLVDFVYDSINLEKTSQMSREEVENLIKKEIIVSKYSEREQKEIINLAKAYQWIEKLVIQRRKLTEEILKDLHDMLLKGISPGGSYRGVNIQLENSRHQPPNYIKVYDRMKKYFFDIERFRGTTVQKAAFAHASISKIHPFLEGNQKIARLVMNYYLLLDGYIPITIPKKESILYKTSIDVFKEEKNLDAFSGYLSKIILERYDTLINQLENI
ncbi:MAG: Fic family protein [Candidatus Phytoplasma sp.]|nr:Fic family protein [Phytoplasma sp.]